MKISFMHPDHLQALAGIADTGTFEGAARLLGVSTSAVSQRMRALEASMGRVLVRRGAPSRLTDEGAVVLRYARQQQLLASELAAELDLEPVPGSPVDDRIPLTVAVNADSLSTWFVGVLQQATTWPDVRLLVSTADEARTAELLRSGKVMAAVSSSRTRVPGCRVEHLGSIRYLPCAAPALLERHRDASSPAELPVLRFDDDDDLQDLALAAAGLAPPAPRAVVPTAEAFAAAVRCGLGWGMVLAAQDPASAGLRVIPGLGPVDRQLYWHHWSIDSTSLSRLSRAVRAAFTQGAHSA